MLNAECIGSVESQLMYRSVVYGIYHTVSSKVDGTPNDENE